ncbi:MAG TPA: VWA domain-containing protein [Bryobacteraceae bacterium]|nr:VWA domain-containing protein [Bryobacteraceae bacterium]
MPPPPEDPNEFKISSEVELVLLDVSVKDANGGFASGLKKEQFKVYEDGKEQEIRIFASQDIPVTVGLVIDNSASMRSRRPEVVTAALTFVQQSNPQDEVFVVNFNDKVSLGLPPGTPFSDDRQQLRQALLGNPVQGRTALNDAVKLALQQLEKGRRDKKTLVVVSDGGDNASAISAADVLRLAEESTATIYTIGIFDEDDKDKNPGFLKRLASVTGGEAFLPQNLGELVPTCEKIAKDIRNRYTIGFAPGVTGNATRKLRVLASAPDRGKLIVRTRTHYIAGGRNAGRKPRR